MAGEIEERKVEVVTGQFLERLFHRFGDDVSVSPAFEKTECRLLEGGIRTNEQGVVIAHASPRSLRLPAIFAVATPPTTCRCFGRRRELPAAKGSKASPID